MPEQAVATIEIDMDKKCSKCGEEGVTRNGLCLTCNLAVSDYISIDCKVESARTDWEKKELKISLAAKREDAEYEAERLGTIARLEQPVRILIYELDKSIEEAIAMNAYIDGVRLDWKIEKLVISLTVDKLADELINKALRLGVMAHMEFPVTARFESAQKRLL